MSIWASAAASCVLPFVTRRHPGAMVFTSFHGRGYRGNPRAVFEHLLRTGMADPVWLSSEPHIVEQVRARFGRAHAELAHSPAGVRALARASAVVLSHGITDLEYLHLPRRAVVLQSWHGLPTKGGELLAGEVSPRERFTLWRKWAPVSHFLSSSPFVSRLYCARFGLPAHRFIELGYPQYDALLDPDAAPLDTAAVFPDAPAHERVVLYAPTFRKTAVTRFFPFPDLEPARLAALLEEQRALVCLRPHPNDRLDVSRALALSPRIVLADDRRIEDVTPLVRRADLIVTDYSGIYVEGLLADVPCVFVPYDRDHYERPFAWDYETYTPGPKVRTQTEFEQALRRALGDRAADREARRAVRDTFFSHVDGRSTQRVAAWLVEAAARGR